MLYIINAGYSFLDSDGIIKTGGEIIALTDDAASAHREKVTQYQDPGSADPVERVDHFNQE